MSKTLQVRDVPEPVHRALRQRAARRGKSLSAYVLEELEHLARQQPLDEWLDELHHHPPVRLRWRVAGLVRREREAR
jgi:hypothetical protein